MNTYERLKSEACEDGIEIIEANFGKNIKGLYCDGTVAINENIKTTTEKACVLAEELGHHYTSVGNIIDMSGIQNRKQERQARLHGYKRLVGLMKLIEAYEYGCQSRYEIAEYLEVTEEYLQECIDCYRDKYGVSATVGEYCIIFIPNLAIYKVI